MSGAAEPKMEREEISTSVVGLEFLIEFRQHLAPSHFVSPRRVRPLLAVSRQALLREPCNRANRHNTFSLLICSIACTWRNDRQDCHHAEAVGLTDTSRDPEATGLRELHSNNNHIVVRSFILAGQPRSYQGGRLRFLKIRTGHSRSARGAHGICSPVCRAEIPLASRSMMRTIMAPRGSPGRS